MNGDDNILNGEGDCIGPVVNGCVSNLSCASTLWATNSEGDGKDARDDNCETVDGPASRDGVSRGSSDSEMLVLAAGGTQGDHGEEGEEDISIGLEISSLS